MIRNIKSADVTKSAKQSLSADDWDNFCNVSLASSRREFENGSKFALLSAIAFCGEAGIKMPHWLSARYCEIIDKITDFEFGSRLFVGTGKYANFDQMQSALSASACQVVTVAVRLVAEPAPLMATA